MGAEVTAKTSGPEWPGRLVVLAGAGISAVSPADVPSWWHFNTAVLNRVRALALQGLALDEEAAEALASIDISDLGVAYFSGMVTDAIGGAHWFELLRHLDGTTPSPCHDSLAQLAADGLLAGIVTTNFDTLIEQAFLSAGVPLRLVDTGTGDLSSMRDDGACWLVKVHGSVTDTSTMVDLASQKLRGLPPHLRSELARVFAEHAVLVLGFSGADLELAEDYLGLKAASPLTPWLRWVTRGDRPPLPTAADIIGRAPGGQFVEGSLPDVLTSLGIAVPPTRPASTDLTSSQEWIDTWLNDVDAGAPAAGALCARFLEVIGKKHIATRIRTVIRATIDRAFQDGLDLVGVLQATSGLSLIGADTVATDPTRAIEDLTRCRVIMKALLPPEALATAGEEIRTVQKVNSAGVTLNLAAAQLQLAKIEDAEVSLREAVDDLADLPNPAGVSRWAIAYFLHGAIAQSRDDNRTALLDYRTATFLARSAGIPHLELAAIENRYRLAIVLGEWELAKALQEERARILPHVPRPIVELGQDLPDLSREVRLLPHEALFRRLISEVRRGGQRLDELLFSLWHVVDNGDESVGKLRRTLAELNPEHVRAAVPEARMLIGVARLTLSEDRDVSLVNDVPAALEEWLFARPEKVETNAFLEAGIRLHPSLRETLILLAQSWAQAGVSYHRQRDWQRSSRQYLTGGIAFILSGEREEATRALLYFTDALARLERHPEAESMLGLLALDAGPRLTSDILTRQLRSLFHRVSAGVLEPASAIESGRSILDRLERLGDTTAIGVGSLSLANLMAMADQLEAAVALGAKAEHLLEGTNDEAAAREAVEALREAACQSRMNG